MLSTKDIYDANASRWARSERVLLSDFTARPRVIEALGPLDGRHVLDLGCGEGYVARLAVDAGAASVHGVDASPEMVRAACEAAQTYPSTALSFEAADAVGTNRFPRASYDRIMAVFLFNYLNRADMKTVMRTAREHLAPGGRFVFTVPHPCFAYMRAPAAPFYFETNGEDYFSAIDRTLEGRIWRRDGADVPVRCVHKTLSDYFDALAEAGFVTLPRVVELAVTDEHLALDSDFFGPLRGYPLHVLFSVELP
jgi:SAM-dependent methyltransferase